MALFFQKYSSVRRFFSLIKSIFSKIGKKKNLYTKYSHLQAQAKITPIFASIFRKLYSINN